MGILKERDTGKYAIKDVKVAVTEAKSAGVLTFSVTVDPSFNSERKNELIEMYGQKGYFILTNIQDLPHKLPEIYKRLTN